MRIVDDLVVEFDKEKALATANALYQTLQKAGICIKVLAVAVHHSIETTRKFHEAMDSLDSKTEGV